VFIGTEYSATTSSASPRLRIARFNIGVSTAMLPRGAKNSHGK
jgi:hypothetical protein